ncbi:MAG: D-arabinono-1,4-lactone oxidase, partial [Acidimicrobiales bacterium]
IRVKSGTRIQELTTQLLPPLDLGLQNMGTFDGQTVSGAVNTGTHGTGLNLGSFGDMVRSADLFVIVADERLRPKVELWRLEPEDGPTKPTMVADLPDVDRLVQDDQLFHAMVVGFGAFGIAYSYLLAARPYYWLREWTEQTTVSGLVAELEDTSGRDGSLLGARNPWAFVNIAWAQVDDRRSGEPETLRDIPVRLVRQHDDVEPEPIDDDFKYKIHPLWPPMRRRDGLFEAVVQRVGIKLSNSGREAGRFVAKAIDKRFIEDDREPFYHTDDRSSYYRVIRRVRDNSLEPAKSPASKWDNSRLDGPPDAPTKAISFDMSVPIDQVGLALETLLAECEAETIKLTVPLGIRFTAASKHVMAASYGRPSAFLELAATVENDSKRERDLQRYKRLLDDIGAEIRHQVPTARPHLCKQHGLDHDSLLEHYPQADEWLRLQGLFNFTGTWTSPFTHQFDGEAYRRSAPEARAWLERRIG